MSTSRSRGKQRAQIAEIAFNHQRRTRARVRQLGLPLQQLDVHGRAIDIDQPVITTKKRLIDPASSNQHRPLTPKARPVAPRDIPTKAPATSSGQKPKALPKAPFEKGSKRPFKALTANPARKSKRETIIAGHPPLRSTAEPQIAQRFSPSGFSEVDEQRGNRQPLHPNHARSTQLEGKQGRQLKTRAELEQRRKSIAAEQSDQSTKLQPSIHPEQQPTQERLGRWLNSLVTERLSTSPVASPELTSSMPPRSSTQDVHVSRETSSSHNDTSSASLSRHETGKSTASTIKDKKKNKELPRSVLLGHRQIDLRESADKLFNVLSLAETLSIPVHHLDFESLHSYAQVYKSGIKNIELLIKQGVRSRSYSTSEAFLLYESSIRTLLAWRPPGMQHRRWPCVTEDDFKQDQSHCSDAGEADFQRSVMMSLIDRHDFQDTFDWSSEEQWSMHDQVLPTSKVDHAIESPRPDLVLWFAGNAIEPNLWRRILVPSFLVDCACPTQKTFARMFPFLFVEAKKGDDSLKPGLERNLHAASQALYNIWQFAQHCPETSRQFFTHVRTFSIAANAKVMQLRIHRAERCLDGSGSLQYKFCKLKEWNEYGRLESCHLVKTILIDYAAITLLPIVKKAFQNVIDNEPLRPAPPILNQRQKRKQAGDENDAAELDDGGLRLNDDGAGEGSQTPRGHNSTGMSFDFEHGANLWDTTSPPPAPSNPPSKRATRRRGTRA